MPEKPYNALLDDHEEECTLDCGCKMQRHNEGGVSITFCSLHEHAKELLKAAEDLIQANANDFTDDTEASNNALAVTSKARGHQ